MLVHFCWIVSIHAEIIFQSVSTPYPFVPCTPTPQFPVTAVNSMAQYKHDAKDAEEVGLSSRHEKSRHEKSRQRRLNSCDDSCDYSCDDVAGIVSKSRHGDVTALLRTNKVTP